MARRQLSSVGTDAQMRTRARTRARPHACAHAHRLALTAPLPSRVPADGYGGFEISLTPAYIATVGVGWLEKGYAYVQANIRGGVHAGTRALALSPHANSLALSRPLLLPHADV